MLRTRPAGLTASAASAAALGEDPKGSPSPLIKINVVDSCQARLGTHAQRAGQHKASAPGIT